MLIGFNTFSVLAQTGSKPASSTTIQLDNHPSIDSALDGQQISRSAPTSPTKTTTNPLIFLVPIAAIILVGLWAMRPKHQRPINLRHQPYEPFSIIGAKGGETERYRNDNDVYADSLNDQERRLRQFYDHEPLNHQQ